MFGFLLHVEFGEGILQGIESRSYKAQLREEKYLQLSIFSDDMRQYFTIFLEGFDILVWAVITVKPRNLGFSEVKMEHNESKTPCNLRYNLALYLILSRDDQRWALGSKPRVINKGDAEPFFKCECNFMEVKKQELCSRWLVLWPASLSSALGRIRRILLG